MRASSVSLMVTNGTVIDGTGARPVPDASVIIGGNRIVAVGRAADPAISSEMTVIDARGGTILPGIIDSHVHSTSDPAVRRSILAGGVTSVCDLGSPKSTMPQFGQNTVNHKPVARGFRAGPMLAAPGGLPDALSYSATISVLAKMCEMLPLGLTDSARSQKLLSRAGCLLPKLARLGAAGRTSLNYEVADENDARAAVADLANLGADVIKVMLHERVNEKTYPILSKDIRAIGNVSAVIKDGEIAYITGQQMDHRDERRFHAIP